jgi:hypothetical protein
LAAPHAFEDVPARFSRRCKTSGYTADSREGTCAIALPATTARCPDSPYGAHATTYCLDDLRRSGLAAKSRPQRRSPFSSAMRSCEYRKVPTKAGDPEDLIRLWTHLTKRTLTNREKALFRGRRETRALCRFLGERGPGWLAKSGRRCIRPDRKGVSQLRLSEWLARCRIDAGEVGIPTAPPRPGKRYRPKSVADLPPTTRYDDDT